MRRALLPLLAVAMAGPAAPAAAQAALRIGTGPAQDVSVPVTSFAERRFASVVRQRYDFSCGSAALATLLRHHYGYDVGEELVFRGMWAEGDRDQIRKVGFSLLDMKRFLASRGLKADGYKVSLDQIADTGVPGVALITLRNYRHFVVLKGVRNGEVLIGDPSAGLKRMPRGEFEKAWNGVYFVLNGEQDEVRSTFNGDVQWAAFSRAPVGGVFLDPLSMQALALSAPFQRDF